MGGSPPPDQPATRRPGREPGHQFGRRNSNRHRNAREGPHLDTAKFPAAHPRDRLEIHGRGRRELYTADSVGLEDADQATCVSRHSLLSTTTNIATVTGDVAMNQCTAAMDSVEVTVLLPPAGPYECTKPIDELSFVYRGVSDVRIRAYKGVVGSTLLADIDGIETGDIVTVTGYAGSPNDVFFEIFIATTDTKIGESKFHLSCSDPDMNGVEDCGKLLGNGKDDDPALINVWELEGIVDAGGALDCTPDPVVIPPGVCGLGFELILVVPPLMWLKRRHRSRRQAGSRGAA